jgi:4-hydroxy-tetrahydrodipicolinate synthase
MNATQYRVYAAAITPIRADGTPDLERLAAHCKYLLAAGCDGVAPLGTTGEAAALPFEYRLRTPEVLAKCGLNNDAILLGVGSPSTGDAIAVGRCAVANGYSNLLALPPYYTKEPSDDGLYDYYARLTEAIDHDRLRLYLYHIPQVTAVAITLELIHRLRKTFGALIVGIKDSSGSFASTEAYAKLDDFEVYPSSEAVLSDAIAIGCKGVISGSTNLSGGLARQVLDASGSERKALQENLSEFRRTIQKFPLIPAVKQVHAWRTGDDGWLRMLPPLRPLSANETASLRVEMDRVGALALQPEFLTGETI